MGLVHPSAAAEPRQNWIMKWIQESTLWMMDLVRIEVSDCHAQKRRLYRGGNGLFATKKRLCLPFRGSWFNWSNRLPRPMQVGEDYTTTVAQAPARLLSVDTRWVKLIDGVLLMHCEHVGDVRCS